jgi:hypothetical protein
VSEVQGLHTQLDHVSTVARALYDVRRMGTVPESDLIDDQGTVASAESFHLHDMHVMNSDGGDIIVAKDTCSSYIDKW